MMTSSDTAREPTTGPEKEAATHGEEEVITDEYREPGLVMVTKQQDPSGGCPLKPLHLPYYFNRQFLGGPFTS